MAGWPIPPGPGIVIYLTLVTIILVRYITIAGVIHYLLWMRDPEKVRAEQLTQRKPTRETVMHEIRLSTLSSFIYAAPGAVLIEMWKQGGTAIYSGPIDGVFGWIYTLFSAGLYLFLHDTYFYWTHRWMHCRAVFSRIHAGHHRSVQPTPWASFSFDPAEALISAWFLPVIALFIPIHVGTVLALLVIMTMNAVFNHAGWEIYPKKWLNGWFGRVLITATHHNLHHTRFSGNYGLYFRFWDRVMGTDHDVP
ncbi:MAG: sterol desaturase family protein [Hyphomonadaceae bacterium]|nr:sterol desaturase family protein [Hyphomonadaceae bacterium]MBC6411820.1 sterol desaturase family protein [Hyphomonadaceae bacterium]